jgi:DDE domain
MAYSPTKPSVSGAKSLGKRTPINSVASARDLATNGTWMRSFSRSRANGTTCGGLSIRRAICSTFWCKAAGTSKLLKGLTYVPRVTITDKLKSYGAAKREILPGVEHRQHRYLNNRAENSHQPTRQREQRMQRFKSSGHAQPFLSAYGPIAQHFRPRRHLLSAPASRQEMAQRFQVWGEITGTEMAAYGLNWSKTDPFSSLC